MNVIPGGNQTRYAEMLVHANICTAGLYRTKWTTIY